MKIKGGWLGTKTLHKKIKNKQTKTKIYFTSMKGYVNWKLEVKL
jgi:hypothetical protein